MTLAGSDNTGVLDAIGTNALFNQPSGMVFVPQLGGLVIADTLNGQLRVLYMNNTVLTVRIKRACALSDIILQSSFAATAFDYARSLRQLVLLLQRPFVFRSSPFRVLAMQLTGPASIYPSLQTIQYTYPRALAFDPARQTLYIGDESCR